MSTKPNLTPRQRIVRARINLIADYPFFGSLAMKLIPKELSEEEVKLLGIPTMAVDLYGNMPFNPKFVMTLDDTTLKVALCHEVMHIALRHLNRLGSRQPMIFNISSDAVINELLSKTFKIPDGWVLMQKMFGKSSEEIYDILIKDAKLQKGLSSWDKHIYESKKKGDKNGQGGQGTAVSGGIKSPFAKDGQNPIDVPRAIREAYNFARNPGKIPAGIERAFADILNPVMDWREILRKYLVQILPHDFSYMKPHKKSYSSGFFMPSIKREEVNITIGVDSSGSIQDIEYAEFLTEIYAMCKQFECLKATIIVCDAAISEVIEIDSSFDPYAIKGRGYGGTDSLPVYKWIDTEKNNNIRLLVYFSDGYINIPPDEKPFHTLWVITPQGTVDTVEKQGNATVIKMPPRDNARDEDE
jgi:predicted metal-dependent peptidase